MTDPYPATLPSARLKALPWRGSDTRAPRFCYYKGAAAGGEQGKIGAEQQREGGK